MGRGDDRLVTDPGKQLLMDSPVLVQIQLPQPTKFGLVVRRGQTHGINESEDRW